MASRISKLLAGDLERHPIFEMAPRFADDLAKHCAMHECVELQFLPLFPAGRGLMLSPRVLVGRASHELSPVFLRLRAEKWELLDEMPPEVEGGPRQFSVSGKVSLEPRESTIHVDATVDILSADQPFLLFDFFDASDVEVRALAIQEKGTPLRFTRHGSLLIVELPKGTRSTELHFRYSAVLPSPGSSGGEFVLYEDWLPYLGGAATWFLQIDVPEDFQLGIPTKALKSEAEGRRLHQVSAEELDRYPIVGSNRPYAVEKFEHQGTLFEIWLHPRHSGRLPDVASALRKSMDAFESIGAFPSPRYRVLEASYAGGHGALGLRDLMVLGEELLDDKHLLPTVAHELSHAWFAGLLRDPQGRWAEGVASYLSQWPLSKERSRLMRWGWMVGYEQVPANRDFTLKGDAPAPRSDEGLAAAILYGKAALALQELEERVGIQKMRQILSLFVLQYRGGSVRWREFQQSVADVMGNSEARRFGRWLTEVSVPEWELSVVEMKGGKLRGALINDSDFAFEGQVLVGTMSEQSEILTVTPVEVKSERSDFVLGLPDKARWLVVDPKYTMPRRGSQDGKPRWMLRIRD